MTVENTQFDEQASENDPNWLKTLRQKARELDKVKPKLAKYERREVAVEAGLDPNDKMHKLFIDRYDGDVEKDALREAASEYFDLDENESQKTDESNDDEGNVEEQQSLEKLQQASSGSDTSDDGPRPAWADAKSAEEFLANYDGLMAP